MSHHDFQKAFQSFPTLFNDSVVELVEVHLARQRWYRHSCALALQDVAEILKVTVTTADGAIAQLEARDVGRHGDEVRRVSRIGRQAMGLRVFDLYNTVSIPLYPRRDDPGASPQSQGNSPEVRKSLRSSVVENLAWPAYWRVFVGCWNEADQPQRDHVKLLVICLTSSAPASSTRLPPADTTTLRGAPLCQETSPSGNSFLCLYIPGFLAQAVVTK